MGRGAGETVRWRRPFEREEVGERSWVLDEGRATTGDGARIPGWTVGMRIVV